MLCQRASDLTLITLPVVTGLQYSVMSLSFCPSPKTRAREPLSDSSQQKYASLGSLFTITGLKLS